MITLIFYEQLECELSRVQCAGTKSEEPEDLTFDLCHSHGHEQSLQYKLNALKIRLKYWKQHLDE